MVKKKKRDEIQKKCSTLPREWKTVNHWAAKNRAKGGYPTPFKGYDSVTPIEENIQSAILMEKKRAHLPPPCVGQP